MFIPENPEEAIEGAKNLLKSVLDRRYVPKNIREILSKALSYLERTDRTPHMRATVAIDTLNEITEKPNVPAYLRSLVLQVVAILESIPPE